MKDPFALSLKPCEVLLYLRKSQSDDPLLTLEELLARHELLLDRWAMEHLQGRIPDENRFRELLSGETLRDRPQIQRLLRRMEAEEYKALLCVEPQRLSRGDWEDISHLMKLLKHSHTLLCTLHRCYDLENEDDWAALERELKQGNDYLEYSKRILNRGRLLSVSQGNYLGSLPPYGYERCRIPEGKRACPSLQIKENEGETVRQIFRWRVEQGLSPGDIARRLEQLAVPPPLGAHWSAAAVASLLSNPHYCGNIRWNRRKHTTLVRNGQLLSSRPVSEEQDILLFPGKHPPLVSPACFAAAQEKKRSAPAPHHNRRPLQNPFASLLYCHCGRAMLLRRDSGKKKRWAPRLVCSDQSHCHTPSCTVDALSKALWDLLPHCWPEHRLPIEQLYQQDADHRQADFRRLQQRMDALQHRELLQWEQYCQGTMPEAVFHALQQKLLTEKAAVERALSEGAKPTATALPSKSVNGDSLSLQQAFRCLALPDTPPFFTEEGKNQLLRCGIQRMEYQRECKGGDIQLNIWLRL